MKRSTLAFFAVCCMTCIFYAQPTITVTAPFANYYGQSLLPSGQANQNFSRGCFLIPASELNALLSTNLTGFGFAFERGTGSSPVNGNMTIYLQNTSDITYSKGTNFTTAIQPMTNAYSGNMTIPGNWNPADVMLSFPSGFNYTGGGLYVAYSWTTTSTPVSGQNYAWYYINQTPGNMGAHRSNQINNAGMNTLVLGQNRPVCLIEAANNATNEAGVLVVGAPGKVAEAMHTSHVITADVKNMSINPLNNINVTLNIGGANSFSDMQVITTLAPGAVTTVSFLPFTPGVLGTNYIDVSIPGDQNSENNTALWDQEVTCNVSSNGPAVPNFTTSFGNPNAGTYGLSRFNFNAKSTLVAINLSIGYDDPTNKSIHGVLMDNTGTILATTNVVNLTMAKLNTVETVSFATQQPLQANQDYYIGMYQTKGYFLAAAETPEIMAGRFFSANASAASILPVDGAFFGIEPIIAGPEITITQPSTVMCEGEQMELIADGANSYTWTCSVFNTIETPFSSSIKVSPVESEIYKVFAMDDQGCSNTATAPILLKTCVGVEENTALQNLNAYPNPSHGKVTISGLEGVNTLTVYNMLGEIVLTKQADQETIHIDLSAQPSGNYLLKIANAQSVRTMKLVHQN